MSEDSWAFSRELNKKELLAAITPRPEKDVANWTNGIALVHVSSTVLADGFVRTIIRIRFRGYGEALDTFAPQQAYWDLESNNSVEQSIVAAIHAHFSA
jgi:hypothetical protein